MRHNRNDSSTPIKNCSHSSPVFLNREESKLLVKQMEDNPTAVYSKLRELSDDDVTEVLESVCRPGGLLVDIAITLLPIVIYYYFGLPKSLISVPLILLRFIYSGIVVEKQLEVWRSIKSLHSIDDIKEKGCSPSPLTTSSHVRLLVRFLKRKIEENLRKLRR